MPTRSLRPQGHDTTSTTLEADDSPGLLGDLAMQSLKGHFLVARPYLTDPNFAKTVVLLFEHSEQGAAGVVINRATDATISGISDQAFEEPLDWDKPIGLGGPVQGPLIALHVREDLADQEILPGLFSTADATKLIVLVRAKEEPTRFVANYAGWASGQLEAELEEASWHTWPADLGFVFHEDITEIWKSLMTVIKREQLASMVELPEQPNDPQAN